MTGNVGFNYYILFTSMGENEKIMARVSSCGQNKTVSSILLIDRINIHKTAAKRAFTPHRVQC